MFREGGGGVGIGGYQNRYFCFGSLDSENLSRSGPPPDKTRRVVQAWPYYLILSSLYHHPPAACLTK